MDKRDSQMVDQEAFKSTSRAELTLCDDANYEAENDELSLQSLLTLTEACAKIAFPRQAVLQ